MLNSNVTPGVKSDEWNQATGKAREAAASVGEMAGHAASAVGDMASHAACEIGKEADVLAARAGVGIQEMGDRLSRSTPQSGFVGTASQSFARTVKDGGEYVQNARLSGMSEDLATLVRRNPIPAICLALGLGWIVGRKLGN